MGTSSSLFVDGVLDDLISLGVDTLVDTCTYYSFIPNVRTNQGNVSTGFKPGVILQCRMDAIVNRLIPQRSKDNIDVQKILKMFYVPIGSGIVYNEKDELESDAGMPGIITRYRVLDVAIETQEADIVLLVEVVT